MKAVSKLVLVLGLIPAISFAATPEEQAYLDTCDKDPRVPVPVTLVSPSVGPDYNGGRVLLEFTVDTTGKPVEFRIANATDSALAEAVVSAVKQWRFQPAQRDGQPIAQRVALPVSIVDPEQIGERYAIGR